MIPYGRQSITDDDIEAVIEVLRSDYLTTGPKIDEFEKKFAKYVGAKYATAVSNGTAALHLACLATGLKKNEEIITTPLTFAASSNCAFYCNAKPVFVDIKKDGLINTEKINGSINERTKIIIPVDYAGFPCDLKEIKEISTENSLLIVEDACHALGARYMNTKIGSCAFSDMAVFSFHPVKHITTGEGGIITTNSKDIDDRLKMLRTHGITKVPKYLEKKDVGPWYYEMQGLGYNYRITDIQAALGISQLEKIDDFVKKRRNIAKKYDDAFENCHNFQVLKEKEDTYCSYHLYP
ncbi:MAG: aminotransferase class I/II-fold pyridoxal phosphate-dependent enzyme, partial [Candidatus Hodarchaeota archaeon]